MTLDALHAIGVVVIIVASLLLFALHGLRREWSRASRFCYDSKYLTGQYTMLSTTEGCTCRAPITILSVRTDGTRQVAHGVCTVCGSRAVMTITATNQPRKAPTGRHGGVQGGRAPGGEREVHHPYGAEKNGGRR